ALEMLYYVPSKQGYDEASKIMESLLSLRPEIVQELVERCNSVKVKRLFLYIAEKHKLPWFSKLNLDRVDLGSGKRVIVENGVLDKKYKITVPAERAF
ncbi:MAG: type IV toxin-antitoxin system AbiEi family antitoxin domain-containing protein, partial [Thermodesulfobacteriota bacterium]